PMARKKTYENLEIIDLEYQGNGVAKPEGRVVFVEGVLPGEVVDVRVTRRKKDVAFAVPTGFHATSDRRVEPFCEHFADCGGCTWQYLGYEDQLAYKERFLAEVLERLGGVTEPKPMPIIGCEHDRFYRNKLDYSFSPTRWLSESEVGEGEQIPDRRALGFHVKGRFNRVLDIRTCYLQRDPSNAIRTAARRIALESDLSFHDPGEHVGLLRSLIIRTTEDEEVMVILVIGEERPDLAAMLLGRLMEEVPQITSAHYIVNTTRNDDVGPHETHRVAGTEVIHERCGHLRFAIHPKSFYQTNSRQAERLYAVVREWLEFAEDDTLLDLYCGIGSIGLFVADRARRVIGVEYVEKAVDRARENAALNGFSNTEFHAGDVRALLAGVGKEHSAIPRPDLIVLDPPRAGVHPQVIDELIRLAPRQMIYVSCKPSTQARDLVRLRERYHIERIQPVDMFPQTFHIESVVDLRRKEEV
ncbi:MAG: 23S rRNA (uracil(1939)-C(5))-methyltransferase RlmD, partial [Spirochaetota bacterium]